MGMNSKGKRLASFAVLATTVLIAFSFMINPGRAPLMALEGEKLWFVERWIAGVDSEGMATSIYLLETSPAETRNLIRRDLRLPQGMMDPSPWECGPIFRMVNTDSIQQLKDKLGPAGDYPVIPASAKSAVWVAYREEPLVVRFRAWHFGLTWQGSVP